MVPSLPTFKPTPSLFPSPVRWVADLIDQSTGGWDLSLLRSLFTADSIPHILALSPPNPYHLDSYIWCPNPRGIFSVKEAVLQVQSTCWAQQCFLSEHDWSLLWKLPIQNRLKLLLWKVASEALPVRAPSLVAFGNSSLSPCANCGTAQDSILHIFHGCVAARFLWSTSCWPLDISHIPISSPTAWVRCLLHAVTNLGISKSSFHMFILHVALTFDVLWFSRNQAFHEDKIVVFSALQSSLSRRFLAHQTAWLVKSPCLSRSWAPQDPGWIKINFDVAFCHDGSYVVVSCRDSSSSLCMAYMERIQATDPLVGVAMAAARALEIALQ